MKAEVKAILAHPDWSTRRLRDDLGCPLGSIYDWKRGLSTPRPRYRERIRSILAEIQPERHTPPGMPTEAEVAAFMRPIAQAIMADKDAAEIAEWMRLAAAFEAEEREASKALPEERHERLMLAATWRTVHEAARAALPG